MAKAPLRITATRHPKLIQIDARAWMARLSARDGRRVTLGDVRPRDVEAIADLGFDLVWLTGTWSVGSTSRRVARSSPSLRQRRADVLPDGSDDDIVGSPYAVAAYEPADASGRRCGALEAAQPARRVRHRADPRLRAQPRGDGASVGAPPSGLVRPRRFRAIAARTRRRISRSDRMVATGSPTAATRTSRRGPTPRSSSTATPRFRGRWPRH
jgi:hypothetical protein